MRVYKKNLIIRLSIINKSIKKIIGWKGCSLWVIKREAINYRNLVHKLIGIILKIIKRERIITSIINWGYLLLYYSAKPTRFKDSWSLDEHDEKVLFVI